MRTICYTTLAFEGGQRDEGPSRGPLALQPFVDLILPKLSDRLTRLAYSSETATGFGPIFEDADLKNLDWSSYKLAYDRLKTAYGSHDLLINIGGDHSVALSTVGAFCENFSSGCVLWIDAHADIHKPSTSPSGNLHGMPLSLLLNVDRIKKNTLPWLNGTLPPDQLIFLGLRDLESYEMAIIRQLGITAYFSETIRRNGLEKILSLIVNKIGLRPLHLSLDVDGIDPEWAPCTGLPVRGGLTRADLHMIATQIGSQCTLRSVDVVEFNPQIGSHTDVTRTALTITNFLSQLLSPFSEKSAEALRLNCCVFKE